MPKICNIHAFLADYELNKFSFFDINSTKTYLAKKTSSFLQSSLRQALQKNVNLKATCYFSGDFLESIVLDSEETKALKTFMSNGQIEPLLGPYYHSFSCLFSSTLFKQEVEKHKELMMTHFDEIPTGFYNTCAIFSNDLIESIVKQKATYHIVPRVLWFTNSDTKSCVYKSQSKNLDLLLVGESKNHEEVIINYTLGSSDYLDTPQSETINATDVVNTFQSEYSYSLPNPIGLDPMGNDITYYLGNSLQKQIFKKISELSMKVSKKKNQQFAKDILTLSTPFIFESMNQGNSQRYDNYTTLVNCLTDLELKLG